MKLVSALLFLPILSAAQSAGPDMLTDQKWYHSFKVEGGKPLATVQKSLYSRPWIYFGKEGFFEDFRSPKEHYRGSWEWNGSLRSIKVSLGTKAKSTVINYEVFRLNTDTLLLQATGPNKTAVGFLSGRQR